VKWKTSSCWNGTLQQKEGWVKLVVEEEAVLKMVVLPEEEQGR
jgi:hypothetical protein